MKNLSKSNDVDEFDAELRSNVSPADYASPTPADRYNLVVIGGGPAGLVTASAAASLGAKVALVEKHALGGDCLNVGCVPSKAILKSARVANSLRKAKDFGVHVPLGSHINFCDVMRRMRQLRATISKNDAAVRFEKTGVDIFFGSGSFVGGNTFEVNGAKLHFSRACISTGARSATPNIPGLIEGDYLTNETIFQLTSLPKRLIIIGGGPIGCEMAQAFSRFGSEVVLIEQSNRILPRDEADAAEMGHRSLVEDNIQILCNSQNLQVLTTGRGPSLSLDSQNRKFVLDYDKLLICVGRTPNLEGLGLEQAGVSYDKRGVYVDDFLRTSNRSIFAAGDVCSALKFTHNADAMARIVIRNSLFFGSERVSNLIVPWVTYTEPEIAHVGISLPEATARGLPIQIVSMSFDELDRAILDGTGIGFARLILSKGTDRILGATVVSNNAGDLISEVALAIRHGLGAKALASTVHPYPTNSEIWRKLGDSYNRTRLNSFTRKYLSLFLSWRK